MVIAYTKVMDFSKSGIKKFNGEDFGLWKFMVESFLKANDLYKVVAGTEEETKAITEIERQKVDCILVQALDPGILVQVYTKNGPKERWNFLIDVYEQKSSDRVQQLNEEFCVATMDSDESVGSFVSRISNIAASLKSCGEEVKDSMIMAQVLSKLPERFSMFVVAWKQRTSADRTLVNMTSGLLSEEQRLKNLESPGPSGAFKASFKKRNTESKSSFRGRCFKCNEVGHLARNCRSKESPDAEQDGDGSGDQKVGRRSVLENTAFMSGHDVHQSEWLADSGAARHICNMKKLFKNMKPMSDVVGTATGATADVIGIGDVDVVSTVHGKQIMITICDVLCVPSFTCSLLSISSLESKGFEVNFKNGLLRVSKGRKVASYGRRKGSLYVMDFVPYEQIFMVREAEPDLMVYHRRLGHVHLERVAKAVNWKGHIPAGVHCDGCAFGKAHRKPFLKDPKKRAEAVGDLIHADLSGPMEVTSLGGSKYFLLIKDDCSSHMFVYFMDTKSAHNVLNKFKEFIVDWKSLTKDKKICRLRSDNGTEFTNSSLQQWCRFLEIKQEFCVPYSPEQNGAIERSMRTVKESARSMLLESGLDTKLWAEAVSTAVHVVNRVPSIHSSKSPYEMITGNMPELGNLRIFGSKAYVHVRDQGRKTWQPKAEVMRLVGYNYGSRSYRLYDPKSHKLKISRDVSIVEDIYEKVTMQCPSEEVTDSDSDVDYVQSDLTVQVGPEESKTSNAPAVPDVPGNRAPVEKRSTRTGDGILAPIDYKETRPYVKRSAGSVPVSERLVDLANLCFMITCDPQGFNEAVKSSEATKWETAMHEEMASHHKCSTWTLVERKPWMNIIKNRWIFKTKLDSDGRVIKYKARLVAKGYSQQEGIDYQETFSPVARYDTIRVLLSVCSMNKKITINQFDVKTAFLNGDLEEDIFMEQPEGFVHGENMVCKLNRSLYGLKQSPRCWNQKLTSVLKKIGLSASQSDPCLFLSEAKDLFLVIYVDDGLILSFNQNHVDQVMKTLQSQFDVTIGDSSCYVGLQIKRDMNSVFIHQESYTMKVLERFKMTDCSPISTPADAHVRLAPNADGLCDQSFKYRELVGSLMFLAIVSRPDIAYAVNVLSQYMNCYGKEHWTAGLRVLKYLKLTSKVGIVYRGGESCLAAYSDADYAGDKQTRRSRTGSVLTLNGGPVVWLSQRQRSVTRSTCESELLAACSACSEIIWTSRLLRELGVQSDGPTKLYIDNQSTIKSIKNPEFHQRLKHVDVALKFIREKYQDGMVDLEFVKSSEQLADGFTKALTNPTFKNLLIALNITDYCN